MAQAYRSSATSQDLAQLFYRAATDRRPKRRYYHSVFDRFVVREARHHLNAYGTMMNLAVRRIVKNRSIK